MAEQAPQPEVLGGGEEPKGLPIPAVSEPSAQAQPSGQQVDVDALAEGLKEKLLPELREVARREAQGLVDKRSYQFETMAEYLKAAGGDPKKAAREMALDQLVEKEFKSPSSEPEVPGRTKGEDPEKRTKDILDEAERDFEVRLTSEELEKVWGGKEYRSWDEAKADVRKAALKKAKGQSIGSGAVVPEAGSGGGQEDEAELTRQLQAIQAGGNAYSPENKKKRAEIKAKLASLRR